MALKDDVTWYELSKNDEAERNRQFKCFKVFFRHLSFELLNAFSLLPGPFDEEGQVVEQTEGVEGVADDLRDSPCSDEQQDAVLTLDLQ